LATADMYIFSGNVALSYFLTQFFLELPILRFPKSSPSSLYPF